VRDGSLPINTYLVLRGLHYLWEMSVFVTASKQVLELLSIQVLISELTIILDHKQPRMSDSFGWWQELAFLLNMFSIASW
jgi:hypothetical protein